MARTTVYLPDELLERARAELPGDVAISQLLQERLLEVLDGECPHDQLVCAKCRRPVKVEG